MAKASANWQENRPTRNDVAKLAKISGTTVSRVLSGRADQSVSPKAREKVLQAARELGYIPNSAAQALRSRSTGLIGFWMCLASSRYRSMVLDQMRAVLKPSDFALAITDVDDEFIGHHSLSRALRLPTDGIIAFDASVSADAFVHSGDQMTAKMPFVSMGAFWSEARSFVGVDLKTGAEDAMEHLLSTGRKRVAYLVPQDPNFVSEGARFQGYMNKVVESGSEPIILQVNDVPARRRVSTGEVLREYAANVGQYPDSLLCFYDDMAEDAVLAIQDLGLIPGKDIAVVGFNGTDGIERGPCPITTVSQPIEEMCRLAFEFLQSQIDDPSAPFGQRVLKAKLIVRESSLPG